MLTSTCPGLPGGQRYIRMRHPETKGMNSSASTCALSFNAATASRSAVGKDGDSLGGDQVGVGGYQGEIEHLSRSGQKGVGGVSVG